MIDTALVAAYRRERRGGIMGSPLPVPALWAIRSARAIGKDETDYGWQRERGVSDGYGVNLIREQDGFTIRARIDIDEYMTLDDMGYGTFDEERGGDRWAVPMYASSQGYSRTTGDHANRWYHPMHSGDDAYAYFRKRGASKDTAAQWTRDAAEREASDAAEAQEFIIWVKVYRAGVHLGTASLGGVGLDFAQDEARQVAEVIEENGMIAEALDEARATLARLTEEQA